MSSKFSRQPRIQQPPPVCKSKKKPVEPIETPPPRPGPWAYVWVEGDGCPATKCWFESESEDYLSVNPPAWIGWYAAWINLHNEPGINIGVAHYSGPGSPDIAAGCLYDLPEFAPFDSGFLPATNLLTGEPDGTVRCWLD